MHGTSQFITCCSCTFLVFFVIFGKKELIVIVEQYRKKIGKNRPYLQRVWMNDLI